MAIVTSYNDTITRGDGLSRREMSHALIRGKPYPLLPKKTHQLCLGVLRTADWANDLDWADESSPQAENIIDPYPGPLETALE